MSFISGLIAGAVIAITEVALEHYGPSFGPFSLSGNGALAAPVILIPLVLFWGWNWIGNRWSGRSDLPIVLYTFGVYLGTGLVAPIDAVAFPQGGDLPTAVVSSIPSVLFTGLIFVLPPAVLGGILYWLFRSGRLPTNFLTVAIGYLVGLPLAFLVPVLPLPVITMGTVTGTAAGHAWRSPGARLLIAIIVIALMGAVVFGIPYLLSTGFQPPALPVP
jgi:hypothetical protein